MLKSGPRENVWQGLQLLAVAAALVLPVVARFESPEAAVAPQTSKVVPSSFAPAGFEQRRKPSTMTSKVVKLSSIETLSQGRSPEYVVEARQLRFEYRPRSSWILEKIERTGAGSQDVALLAGEAEGAQLSSFVEVDEGRSRFRAIFRDVKTGRVRNVEFYILHVKTNS